MRRANPFITMEMIPLAILVVSVCYVTCDLAETYPARHHAVASNQADLQVQAGQESANSIREYSVLEPKELRSLINKFLRRDTKSVHPIFAASAKRGEIEEEDGVSQEEGEGASDAGVGEEDVSEDGQSDEDEEDEVTCSYNGVVYQAGARFPSSDKCNRCMCLEVGYVACTRRFCYRQPNIQLQLPEHPNQAATENDDTTVRNLRELHSLWKKASDIADKRWMWKRGSNENEEDSSTEEEDEEEEQVQEEEEDNNESDSNSEEGMEEYENQLTCEYHGNTYNPGDRFKSHDDCNRCWCMGTIGQVACTRRRCPSRLPGLQLPHRPHGNNIEEGK